MQKKKGISLIVLVITIIVIIILAAAIIISLNNSGIIGKANKAVKDTNEQEVNHIAELAWSEAYLNGARTEEELTEEVKQGLINAGLNPNDYGMIVTTKGVKISKGWVQDGVNITKGDVTLEAGDLIQYNVGINSYTGAWKVLGAEDGNLLILSTIDIGTLGLCGPEGGTYNNKKYDYGLLNGVQRLNELCEPYGRGTGAVGARSIKVEDVDKLTGYDKTTYGTSSQLFQYGNEVTYSWNTTYYERVDYTSTNSSGTLYTTHSNFRYVDFDTMTLKVVALNGTGMPTLTTTGYAYQVDNTTLPTRSEKATEMLFGTSHDNDYWLASPYVFTTTNYVEFGLRAVEYGGYVALDYLFGSHKYVNGLENGVRAVVSLSSDIQIGEKDNTLGWAYTI